MNRTFRRSSFAIGLASLAVTSFIVLVSTAPTQSQTPAVDPGSDIIAPFQQSKPDKTICALSEKQEQEAIEAFHHLATVFREPRCLNCHGSVNPFVEGGGHVGGVININETLQQYSRSQSFANAVRESRGGMSTTDQDVQQARDAIEHAVSHPDTGDADIGSSNRDLVFLSCQQCHSVPPLPRWRVAMVKNWFAHIGSRQPKGDEQLCELMRAHTITGDFATPADFLNHLDHEDFVMIGFKGNRGLNDNGILTYEDVTKKTFRLEPPSMPHGEMMKWAKAWAEAIGDRYWNKRPKDCGCKPHRYGMRAQWNNIYRDPEISAFLNTKATPGHAPLVFNDDASFKLQMDMVAQEQAFVAGECRGNLTLKHALSIEGNVDESAERLRAKPRWAWASAEGIIVCTDRRGRTTYKQIKMPMDPTPSSRIPEFDMAAQTDETKELKVEWNQGSQHGETFIKFELMQETEQAK